jgi:regulator of replication initiation timing
MITRDEFIKNLKTQLDEMNTGIDEIEQKAKSVRENTKERLQVRIKYLRRKRDSAYAKIQDVKNTSEEAWQDLKQGTENTFLSLKDALTKTMAHFKKGKSKLAAEKVSE